LDSAMSIPPFGITKKMSVLPVMLKVSTDAMPSKNQEPNREQNRASKVESKERNGNEKAK
jgi:hypothetical protein